MTVGELKEALRNIPDETLLLIESYERGYCDPEIIGMVPVYTYPDNTGVYGKYDRDNPDFYRKQPDWTAAGNAFVLDRTVNEYIL